MHKDFSQEPMLSKKDFIKQIFIKSEDISDRELFNGAREYYENDPLEEYTERDIGMIMVNHIRHQNTSYDIVLDNIKYNNAVHYYPLIKKTVLKLIGKKYPYLKKECCIQRQLI